MSESSPKLSHSEAPNLVVVIHGWSGHRLFMLPICWKLKRAGFRVKQFGYRSLLWSVETHAKRFGQFLRQLDDDPANESFHIVAHSMGGIVTRTALLDLKSSNQELKKLKRIVMLAVPNHGSPVAKVLGAIFPFCKTLRQLSDQEDGFIRKLEPPDKDLNIGVIAASYDFVVPKHSSHLENETDHITLFSGHNGVLVRPVVGRRIVEFLKQGQFVRRSNS